MNERLIKKLIATVKCSICGKSYEIDNIEILGHQDETWFLNIFCPTCDKESFVTAIIKKEKAQDIMSDLVAKERIASIPDSAISSDDLVELHNFLKDFNGDFLKLFSQG